MTMMTNCNYIIVVKFLIIFLIFVSSKTILASYDRIRFEEYDEAQMEPAPMPSPDESSQYEVFDVSKFGATAAAESDDTIAFKDTWEAACKNQGRTRFYVPEGKYLVGAIDFLGPCRSESTMEVEMRGELVAPASIKEFRFNQWITFHNLNDILVYGGSNLDGQGKVEAWNQTSCARAWKCDKLITSLILANVTNAIVKDISLSNSKGFHMNLRYSHNVTVQNITLSSPWNSPNTDGIHVHSSSNIKIADSNIGVGDDCISISTGSLNVLVSNTHCGPGHGISIGSLGRNKNEEEVRGIKVKNCTINGTDNGVRIKSWPSSPAPSQAGYMTFEDIVMVNVSNPIIIDQEYCPHDSCNTTFASMVKLSNIEFKNVRGTYNTEFGVTLRCSSLAACENITLTDVNLNRINATNLKQRERLSMKGGLHGLAISNSTFN